MTGLRSFLVDLRQPDLDVTGDLLGQKGRPSYGLAQQVECLGQISLRHVDIDNQTRLADARAERNSLAFQQFGELFGGIPGGSLVEGPGHDRGNALALW